MTQWKFDPGTIDFKVGPFTVAQIPWYSRGSYMQFIELAQPVARGENILPPGQSGTLLVNPQGHLVADPHFDDQVELARNWQYKPMPLYYLSGGAVFAFDRQIGTADPMEVPMKKTVALLLCVGLILGALGPRVANTANTLIRELDPVVVLGSAMPDFAGVPLAQLFVYKYSGGAWSQIPWQFDEVVGGVIVTLGNGLLDAQDQLVFMAAEAGDQAPAQRG